MILSAICKAITKAAATVRCANTVTANVGKAQNQRLQTMNVADNSSDLFYQIIDRIPFDHPPHSVSNIDWRQFLREYEQWVEDYIELLEKYVKNPTDITLLSDYLDYIQRLIEWAEQAERIEAGLANDTEALREYLATLLRITQRLAEVQ